MSRLPRAPGYQPTTPVAGQALDYSALRRQLANNGKPLEPQQITAFLRMLEHAYVRGRADGLAEASTRPREEYYATGQPFPPGNDGWDTQRG